jgi:hypothetical protein
MGAGARIGRAAQGQPIARLPIFGFAPEDRIAKAAIDPGRLCIVARLRHGLKVVPIVEQRGVAIVRSTMINDCGRTPASQIGCCAR